MDQEAGDGGRGELIGVFERGNDLVDTPHGKLVRQGAVAVDLDTVVMAGHPDVVDVQDLRKLCRYLAQRMDEEARLLAVTRQGFGLLDGGGFRLDVGEDGGDRWDFVADIGFEVSNDVMCLTQGERFVKFKMKFKLQLVVILLDRNIMDGQIGACRHGSDAIMDGFSESRGG